MEDIQKKTVATFESIDINTINEMQRSVVVLPDKKEEKNFPKFFPPNNYHKKSQNSSLNPISNN